MGEPEALANNASCAVFEVTLPEGQETETQGEASRKVNIPTRLIIGGIFEIEVKVRLLSVLGLRRFTVRVSSNLILFKSN